MSYVGIVLTLLFVNNIVLAQFLGMCPFLGVSRRSGAVFALGVSTTAVATVSSIGAWALRELVLLPLGLGFLQTFAFVLLCAGVAIGTERILAAASYEARRSAGLYLPAVTANCAVLGIVLIAVKGDYGLIASVVASAAAGAGAILAMLILSGIRSRLDAEWIPRAFRGTPIVLISTGLIALAFMAFDHAFLRAIVG